MISLPTERERAVWRLQSGAGAPGPPCRDVRPGFVRTGHARLGMLNYQHPLSLPVSTRVSSFSIPLSASGSRAQSLSQHGLSSASFCSSPPPPPPLFIFLFVFLHSCLSLWALFFHDYSRRSVSSLFLLLLLSLSFYPCSVLSFFLHFSTFVCCNKPYFLIWIILASRCFFSSLSLFLIISFSISFLYFSTLICCYKANLNRCILVLSYVSPSGYYSPFTPSLFIFLHFCQLL